MSTDTIIEQATAAGYLDQTNGVDLEQHEAWLKVCADHLAPFVWLQSGSNGGTIVCVSIAYLETISPPDAIRANRRLQKTIAKAIRNSRGSHFATQRAGKYTTTTIGPFPREAAGRIAREISGIGGMNA